MYDYLHLHLDHRPQVAGLAHVRISGYTIYPLHRILLIRLQLVPAPLHSHRHDTSIQLAHKCVNHYIRRRMWVLRLNLQMQCGFRGDFDLGDELEDGLGAGGGLVEDLVDEVFHL